ncbi:InlB B-repeat-containing protein, partial [Mageeibacillus indolicus]|uniref:InlB B-repeat-containing protein n=1 Tax=Mageeibacillus indolicus TaxID=884684 RepID=UPI0004DCBCFA
MNRYLRKIAAVLSLTLVLTSFDCTALRAVNTVETNAVNNKFSEMTKQGDTNTADQMNAAEPNAAKADGTAKKQAATKPDEGKAEATKANTKAISKPQPKYIIAEPVTGNKNGNSVAESHKELSSDINDYRNGLVQVPYGLEEAKNDKGRSKRSRRSVSDLDRAAYEDRSEIGLDRSTPEAGSTTGTPNPGKAKDNGDNNQKTYGAVPTDGLGTEKGEKPDHKIKEPDGAYLNRHLPLKARYLGDPTDPDEANKQVKNETPHATYSYKMHFVLLRYKTSEDGKSYVAMPREFHKPYQITVGEENLTPSVDGTKFVVPHKEGYENPIRVDGLLIKPKKDEKTDNEDDNLLNKDKINEIKTNGEKVDYDKITFMHNDQGSPNAADKSIYYIKNLANQKDKPGYHHDDEHNQNVFEQTFVYMPKKASIAFKYLCQSQSDPTQFNEAKTGTVECVDSSIGAQFSPTEDDYIPKIKGNPALEKEIRAGFKPASEKINVLVPETDKCGDFIVSLHLLRRNFQAIFDVVEEAADKVPTRQFAYGQTITFPKNEPTYEGYEFLGWLPANGKNVYQYANDGKHLKTIFDSEAMKKEREEVVKELEALLTSDEKKMSGKDLEGDALVNRALMKAKTKKPDLLERYKNTFLPNRAIENSMPPENITFKAQWMMKPTGKYTYSYWLEKPDDPQGDKFADKYVYLYSDTDTQKIEENGKVKYVPAEVATFTSFSSEGWLNKLQDKTDKIKDDANNGNDHTKFFEWDRLKDNLKGRAKFQDFFEFDKEATVKENAGMYVTSDGRADCKIIFKRRRYTLVFTRRPASEDAFTFSLSFRSEKRDHEGNPILLPNGSKSGAPYVCKSPEDSTAKEPEPKRQLKEEERKDAPYQFTARFGQSLDNLWPDPFFNCTLKGDGGESASGFLGWVSISNKTNGFSFGTYFDTPPYCMDEQLLYVQYGEGFYNKGDRLGYCSKEVIEGPAPSVLCFRPDHTKNPGNVGPYLTLLETQSVDGQKTEYKNNGPISFWRVRLDTFNSDYHGFKRPHMKGFTPIDDDSDLPGLDVPEIEPATSSLNQSDEKDEDDLDQDLGSADDEYGEYGEKIVGSVDKSVDDIIEDIKSGVHNIMTGGETEYTGFKYLNVRYARNRYPITILNVKNEKSPNAFYDDSLLHALHVKDQPLTDADRPDSIQPGWVFDGYTFDEQNKLRIDQPGYTMPDHPITVFAKWMDPKIHDLTIDLQGGHFDKLPEQSELTDFPFNDTFYKAETNPIKVKTKGAEKTVPVDKLKDCNPYSVDAITYRIKSGKNVLPFTEVPTKPGYLFLGWEAVRYELTDKKEIKRDKDGKPLEDNSYFENYKAHEFFSFNNPMAEPMGIRAIWGKLEYKPVYIEHHFFDKQNNEIGKELDLAKLLPGIDVSEFMSPLKGVLKVQNAVPGSNLAAMADYENYKWVLVSNDKNETAGDTDLEEIYKKNYPGKTLSPDFKNKFIQNKMVEENGTNIIRFFYKPFSHRFYYVKYACVDEDKSVDNPSSPQPLYTVKRDLDKFYNDNFDYDVINYQPLHGYKLFVPKKKDGAQGQDEKNGLQQVLKFTEDNNGDLLINGKSAYEYDFMYKDYRVLVRNSKDDATPNGYHRVIFELDKNMEFVTNYEGAFNGITKGSKLKDIVDGQGKNKTISNLLGMGGELEYGVKDVDKVCKRRYIVDVADGVDDANIPLPPIQPVRYLPVSLLWIDQKGLNFYSHKLYESTPGEIEEEDLEKTLDEAVPPQPEPERKLSFSNKYKVNVELTPKNKGTEPPKKLTLKPINLNDKGDYKDQPRWVKIEDIPASQDLICQRVSGSPRKDANGALPEPKALTDGTLARNENADNAKLAADAKKCSLDGVCKELASNAEGHEGEGRWNVEEPAMNKLELTDFADLTAPKDDEKFERAAEKQDGVPAWQKKPYQKKTIQVFAKGSEEADNKEDCCNIKIDKNKLPPRIWTKAFLDKLKEIDYQPHDILEWSASEEGAQEQTDGVEKGIFVEHKVLVNNKESTRLFEVELFGSTENELFVVNSEVPTIDVEVHKYWFGKYGQPLDFNTLSVGSAANPKPLTMEMRFMDPRILLKPQTVDLTAANKWHDWIRNVRLKFRRTSPRTYDYELHEV